MFGTVLCGKILLHESIQPDDEPCEVKVTYLELYHYEYVTLTLVLSDFFY